MVGDSFFPAKPSFGFSVGLLLREALGLVRYRSSYLPELSTGGRSYVLNVLYVLMFPAQKRRFPFKNQIVAKSKSEKFNSKSEKFNSKSEKFNSKSEKFNKTKKQI